MKYYKSEIFKLIILGLIGFNLMGCGSSNSKQTQRDTFDKAYYKSIDYRDVDKLTKKFIDRDARFVDFKTEIPLPKILIQTEDKNYTIEKILQGQNDEGIDVFFYESEELVYYQYEDNNLTSIAIIDKKSQRTLAEIFSEEQITEVKDPISISPLLSSIISTSTITYSSEEFNVTFPETVTSNGSATVEYDKASSFAVIKNGDLGLDAFNKLVDITQNYPNIKEIRLKNIDGSVHDGINMQTGLLLRKSGLNTYVLDTDNNDTDIASGGVDLFTAGVKRKIENQETVKLGIHSWGGEDNNGTTVQGKDFQKEHKYHHDQLLYFSKMLGVDVGYDFYFRTLEAADADDIHIMTDDEIVEYNILN